MRIILGLVIFLSVCKSTLAREVNISLADNQTTLTLVNPSTVSVNYDIVCHKPDGSGTLLSSAGNTLAPKAKVNHTASIPDSGKCAGNANPTQTMTDSSGKSFYFCSGANSYANANSACGTGNSFCFPDVSGWTGTCSCSTFWLKNDGTAEFMPSCGSYGAVTAGSQIGVGNFTGGSARKNSSVSPCAYFGYAAEYVDSTTRGSVCCSAPVGASVCKITINTTNSAAHLSSPSFLGGAAF